MWNTKNGRRGGEIWKQSATWSWSAEEISMKIVGFLIRRFDFEVGRLVFGRKFDIRKLSVCRRISGMPKFVVGKMRVLKVRHDDTTCPDGSVHFEAES